jgi:hypothetical protein
MCYSTNRKAVMFAINCFVVSYCICFYTFMHTSYLHSMDLVVGCAISHKVQNMQLNAVEHIIRIYK